MPTELAPMVGEYTIEISTDQLTPATLVPAENDATQKAPRSLRSNFAMQSTER